MFLKVASLAVKNPVFQSVECVITMVGEKWNLFSEENPILHMDY